MLAGSRAAGLPPMTQEGEAAVTMKNRRRVIESRMVSTSRIKGYSPGISRNRGEHEPRGNVPGNVLRKRGRERERARRGTQGNGWNKKIKGNIDRRRSRFGREDGSTSPSDPPSAGVNH